MIFMIIQLTRLHHLFNLFLRRQRRPPLQNHVGCQFHWELHHLPARRCAMLEHFIDQPYGWLIAAIGLDYPNRRSFRSRPLDLEIAHIRKFLEEPIKFSNHQIAFLAIKNVRPRAVAHHFERAE